MKMARFVASMATLVCMLPAGHAREPVEEPALVAPLLSMRFGGTGQHEVELDGYGTCRKAHWVHEDVEGGIAAANHPYVSPAVPKYYHRHGAPIAYVRGSTPSFTA